MQSKVIKGLIIGTLISGLTLVAGCGSNTDAKVPAPAQPPAQAQQVAKTDTIAKNDAAKYIQVIKDQNVKIYQLSKDGKFADARNEFKALDDAFTGLKPFIKNEELKKKLGHAIEEIGDELKKDKPKKSEMEEEYEVVSKVLKDIEAQLK